ncbi:VOC family protein [Glaciimonas sp. PCH181]|uniref:VOC family protein n=1 Tax=Glaciimonas sp. PCH181 TaxID=2133943 RepID=UPI0026B3F498
MSNIALDWFEIYVQDMHWAKAFYESVLGVQLAKLNNPKADMWVFSNAKKALCRTRCASSDACAFLQVQTIP